MAVETIGDGYGTADEIEGTGMKPRLVHARNAELMRGRINKTEKLDAKGLNLLQRVGTLPIVWIPSGETRDLREWPRTRMVLASIRTKLKNRIHANLVKYGHTIEASDTFAGKGLRRLKKTLKLLPAQTLFAREELLEELASVKSGNGAASRGERIHPTCSRRRSISISTTPASAGDGDVHP